MGIVAVLVGLFAGNLLNILIDRQARLEATPASNRHRAAGEWLPIFGTWRRRDWVALAVEILTSLIAAALMARYGLTPRALFLFVASLVLIDTGAVDFRVRLIDPLIMLGAMLAALALAPLNNLSWFASLCGMVVAALLFLFFFVLSKVLFPSHAVPFGLGDVYLAGFIGALVGLLDLSPALFNGMLMAGVVSLALIVLRTTGRAVPMYIAYGTYLCLGALLFLAGGHLT